MTSTKTDVVRQGVAHQRHRGRSTDCDSRSQPQTTGIAKRDLRSGLEPDPKPPASFWTVQHTNPRNARIPGMPDISAAIRSESRSTRRVEDVRPSPGITAAGSRPSSDPKSRSGPLRSCTTWTPPGGRDPGL
jgi:hypothetical protein